MEGGGRGGRVLLKPRVSPVGHPGQHQPGHLQTQQPPSTPPFSAAQFSKLRPFRQKERQSCTDGEKGDAHLADGGHVDVDDVGDELETRTQVSTFPAVTSHTCGALTFSRSGMCR